MESRRVKKVVTSWPLLPRWEALYCALAAQGSKFFVMSYLCRSAQFQFLEVYWQSVFVRVLWMVRVKQTSAGAWTLSLDLWWFLPFICPMSENICQSQRNLQGGSSFSSNDPYVHLHSKRHVYMFLHVSHTSKSILSPLHHSFSSSKLLLKLSLDGEGKRIDEPMYVRIIIHGACIYEALYTKDFQFQSRLVISELFPFYSQENWGSHRSKNLAQFPWVA